MLARNIALIALLLTLALSVACATQPVTPASGPQSLAPRPGTDTPMPPSATPVRPTDVLVPPTNSPEPPTFTPVSPTETAGPTGTPIPTPTSTTLPPLSGQGGGRIAFVSRREGSYEIYVMNADGSDQRRLTNMPEQEVGEPDWSPDGSQIAFTSSRESNGRIYVMDADGSNRVRLTSGPGTGPHWSPDGALLTFTRENRGADIYVMDASGSNQRRLTQSDVTGSVTLVFGGDWSPDGAQVVSVVEYNPEGDFFGERTLHLLNIGDVLQGGESVELRPLPKAGDRFNDHPAWSPVGTQIAFSAVVAGHRDIYVVNADGTNLKQLTFTENFDEQAPAWSPDGTQIAFQANPDGQWDIYVMKADGSDVRRLTTGVASDVDPAWSADRSRLGR